MKNLNVHYFQYAAGEDYASDYHHLSTLGVEISATKFLNFSKPRLML